ncbi:uncharacterized protein A4U43_C07F13880 [Asparagus officinalis]|uniref:Uncharacterized protein n=1 Tax=Asparagus officinalis TaxID=4686 RepID=A0A5P1EER2_ASPOF|nr:uncharacterized protein A4U43_C07F13880 [Asparagus officinalis]
MEPRHFAAYEDSVFRHYVHFGPPGVDLPTFKHILSQWDKKSKKFVFTDRNDGEEIVCSFNLEWVIPQDIDEDVEQPNEAVEQMKWPQQVIYWKSIVTINQALRRENENKFKDMIVADRVKISALSVKYEGDVNQSLFDEANKESEDPPTRRASSQSVFTDINKESEDAPPEEVPPPENYHIDTTLEVEINEGEKVSPPAKELLTCTKTSTQHEDTGRKITPVVDVPSAGYDTETMEIKQSEDAPPPAPDTSTDDEDAPIRFSRALNKRKRGARGAREKVSAAAPLKRKRCIRAVKHSKWVVTPYTEGKKKKEKENIGDKAIIEVAGEEEEQVQEKLVELAPARLQSDLILSGKNT